MRTLAKLAGATSHRRVVAAEREDGRAPGLPDSPLGRRLRQGRREVMAGVEHAASGVRVFGAWPAARTRRTATSTWWSTWPRVLGCSSSTPCVASCPRSSLHRSGWPHPTAFGHRPGERSNATPSCCDTPGPRTPGRHPAGHRRWTACRRHGRQRATDDVARDGSGSALWKRQNQGATLRPPRTRTSAAPRLRGGGDVRGAGRSCSTSPSCRAPSGPGCPPRR